jgi:hypothetical protein
MSAAAILEFLRQHPLWPIGFLLVYLGNHLVFLAYAFALLKPRPFEDSFLFNGTDPEGRKVFGVESFHQEFFASWLNLGLYVALTLPPYVLLFWAQIAFVVPTLFSSPLSQATTPRTGVLNVSKFCAYHCSLPSCLVAIPGLHSVLCWAFPRWPRFRAGIWCDFECLWAFCYLSSIPLVVSLVLYGYLWIRYSRLSMKPSQEVCDESEEGVVRPFPVSSTSTGGQKHQELPSAAGFVRWCADDEGGKKSRPAPLPASDKEWT